MTGDDDARTAFSKVEGLYKILLELSLFTTIGQAVDFNQTVMTVEENFMRFNKLKGQACQK
ncbi:MAG: hypothetical protein AB2L18_06260 [Anaerolineaceae bacterium]